MKSTCVSGESRRLWFAVTVLVLAFMSVSAAPKRPRRKRLPKKTVARELTATGRLLLIPINDKSKGRGIAGTMIRVYVGDKLIHACGGALATDRSKIGWWGYLDISEFVGKTLKITGESENPTNSLDLIETSDNARYLTPVYTETGRPQWHFSQKQGWNNDPNGMFYHDGLWHISWQCNPLGLGWSNMYWGHAVSKDLIHWEEWPRILRAKGGRVSSNMHPALAEGMCFSGSGAVDHNNTLGLQTGKQKTLLACFTNTGTGECLAASTDNGHTYKILRELNPLIKHSGRDPRLFWYAPGRHWVIAAYRAGKKSAQGKVRKTVGGKIVFYTSPDLKTWTEESFSDEGYHECPEFMELPVDGDPNNRKWLLFDAGPKYQTGSFDGKKFTADHPDLRFTISGSVKAGQCFNRAPGGRVICVFWSRVSFGADAPFNQGFTTFMDVSLRTADDGVRMYVNPIRELESLWSGELVSVTNQPLKGSQSFKLSEPGTLLDIQLTLKTSKELTDFMLKLGDEEIPYDFTTRTFPNGKGRDRQLSGWALKVHDKEDGKFDLRVLVDRGTVEVFGENGSVYYLDGRENLGKAIDTVQLRVNGGSASIESLKVYKLKSIWRTK